MSDFPARELAVPEPGRASAESFVAQNLGHLVEGPMVGSAAFRGGQTAADAALAGFDVAGYATRRNEVYPAQRRGASPLSQPSCWRRRVIPPPFSGGASPQ